MEEGYKQESMLSPDGTMPDSSIVSRNRANEADLIFQTEGQKKAALELVREGKAKDLSEAWTKMRDDSISDPVNDAWANKNK